MSITSQKTVGIFLYWDSFQEQLIIRRLALLWTEEGGVSASGGNGRHELKDVHIIL